MRHPKYTLSYNVAGSLPYTIYEHAIVDGQIMSKDYAHYMTFDDAMKILASLDPMGSPILLAVSSLITDNTFEV